MKRSYRAEIIKTALKKMNDIKKRPDAVNDLGDVARKAYDKLSKLDTFNTVADLLDVAYYRQMSCYDAMYKIFNSSAYKKIVKTLFDSWLDNNVMLLNNALLPIDIKDAEEMSNGDPEKQKDIQSSRAASNIKAEFLNSDSMSSFIEKIMYGISGEGIHSKISQRGNKFTEEERMSIKRSLRESGIGIVSIAEEEIYFGIDAFGQLKGWIYKENGKYFTKLYCKDFIDEKKEHSSALSAARYVSKKYLDIKEKAALHAQERNKLISGIAGQLEDEGVQIMGPNKK
jgi:hypothetical protein